MHGLPHNDIILAVLFKLTSILTAGNAICSLHALYIHAFLHSYFTTSDCSSFRPTMHNIIIMLMAIP